MTDWSRIQGIANRPNGPVPNPLNLAFGSTVPIGDGVVGAVLMDTGVTLTSVTDDKGNGYTIFAPHDDGILSFAAFRSNGFLTNSPKTLTYTTSGGATLSTFWQVQDDFQPPTGATLFSVDGSSVTFNSGGTSFTNFSTTSPDDLAYAAAFSSGTSTHGASFNQGSGDGTQVCSEWGIQAAAGTVTMNLATQAGSLWGPAFALNAGNAGPAFVPFGVLGLASNEW